MACVAVFDLDGTLTWRDTLGPFLFGYAVRRPGHWWRCGPLLAAILAYALQDRDRGRLKSHAIGAIMGGDSRRRIDAWSNAYVASLHRRRAFRPASLAAVERHRVGGDHLVLLSASPDLYVPRIGRLLGFERVLCTELAWRGGPTEEARLDGSLLTPNRRGPEKVCCLQLLRRVYGNLPVVAYGNSESDLAHLQSADRGWLVNGSRRARRLALERGISLDEWN